MFITNPGDILLFTMIALGMLAAGALMWLAGGYFTLSALSDVLGHWDVTIPSTGLGRWSIPLGFSVVEVAIFRFRSKLPKWVLVVGGLVMLFDFLSTVYGIALTIAGADIKLLTGLKVPPMAGKEGRVNLVPVLVGMVGSAVLTFAPEQIIINALGMLWKVATGLWKTWG